MAAQGLGRETTAAEVVAGVDLTGKHAVVTGATSGIGIETVRALAQAGASVTVGVRDVRHGQSIAESIDGQVDVRALDLADSGSIRTFAAAWSGPLDILVNNAGIMSIPELRKSPEGWELQLAVNHLGHFGLSVLLLESLKQADAARVVAVSSSAHTMTPVDFDDLHFDHRPYDAYLAYAQSKTANVLFAVGASERWASEGITVHAVMPGLIKTGIQRHVDPDALKAAQAQLDKEVGFKSAAQGAATSVFAAVSPSLAGVPATYLEDCAEAPITRHAGHFGVAPYALDHGNADRLWELSAQALGLTQV
jgi:NAD(P)-dependent dehydrogenase (short-subunit alcohol dehydrogenase family)